MTLAEQASAYIGEAALRRFVFGDEPIPSDYLAWAKATVQESAVSEDGGRGARCPQPVRWLPAAGRANVLGMARFGDGSTLDVLKGAVYAW